MNVARRRYALIASLTAASMVGAVWGSYNFFASAVAAPEAQTGTLLLTLSTPSYVPMEVYLQAAPASTSPAAASAGMPGLPPLGTPGPVSPPPLGGTAPAPATASAPPALPAAASATLSAGAPGATVSLPVPSAPTPSAVPAAGSALPPLDSGAAFPPASSAPSLTSPLPPVPSSLPSTDAPAPSSAPLPSLGSVPSLSGAPATSADSAVTMPSLPPVIAPAAPAKDSALAPALEPRSAATGVEQGKDTVSLPASNGATNFTGAPIDSPAKVIATITPPTVRMTPMPSTNPRALADPVLPYRRRNAIALPEFARPDFSDQDSPFILKTPPPVLKNYASSADRQLAATQLGPAPIQTELEVITVAGGKQFAGHVLQRGVSYRVQLPNGSVLSFPAERVISVNPAQPMVPAAPVVLPAGM